MTSEWLQPLSREACWGTTCPPAKSVGVGRALFLNAGFLLEGIRDILSTNRYTLSTFLDTDRSSD